MTEPFNSVPDASQAKIESLRVQDALGSLDEARALLVLAYKGGSYKSKINSALRRLTHVERILRVILNPTPPPPDWNYTSQPGKLGGPASGD